MEESDDDRPQAKAGLCKRCWKIFRDRQDFEHHLGGQPCTKVSRGKREKFWLLFEAFCAETEPGGPHEPRRGSSQPLAPP